VSLSPKGMSEIDLERLRSAHRKIDEAVLSVVAEYHQPDLGFNFTEMVDEVARRLDGAGSTGSLVDQILIRHAISDLVLRACQSELELRAKPWSTM
jgi:hypothetical protein